MNLDNLTQIYPTDKCIPGYSQLFSPVRTLVKNVLEIGCVEFRTDNSLRIWRDYFPNAQIYGADILPCDEHNTEERITMVITDKSSKDDLIKLANLAGGKFDIIINRGSHYALQQFCFSVLEKYLTDNGIYVIENVQHEFIEVFKRLLVFPPEVRDIICANYEINWFDMRDDFRMVFKRRMLNEIPIYTVFQLPSSNSHIKEEIPLYTVFQPLVAELPITKPFFFVILRSIQSEDHKELWWRSYSSIRKFYPTTRIIIIDDNSIISDERDTMTTNTSYEKSEFPAAGELLPYYYFLLERWTSNREDKMIFLHDSMFLIRQFTYAELSGDIRFLWHFDQHEYDDDNLINNFLASFTDSTALVNMNSKKSMWYGCFGTTSICSLGSIQKLEQKYSFFSNAITLTKNRDDRMAIERVFGLICFHSELVNKVNCSVFGRIHDYHGCWQADHTWKVQNLELYPYAVLKTWTGR